jgi:2-iminobutanoate/2-iminopropanoate deaminase
MEKKIIETMNAPKPVGPYSQAVQAGGFLFCSGQIAINPQTDEVINADVGTQARQCMTNIKALLAASGLSMDHIVKTTIFLLDMNDFATVNSVYAGFFERKFPARSTVAVVGLPKGVRVEIEVIALAN